MPYTHKNGRGDLRNRDLHIELFSGRCMLRCVCDTDTVSVMVPCSLNPVAVNLKVPCCTQF